MQNEEEPRSAHDDGGGGFEDERVPGNSPSWLHDRPRHSEDAFGVIGAPVFVENPGIPSTRILTGGWRGRKVSVPNAFEGERCCMLWRVPEPGRTPYDMRSGEHGLHGWFLPMGRPSHIGRVMLPSELLMFLADRAKDSLVSLVYGEDRDDESADLATQVLKQFVAKEGDGPCVQAAMLLAVDPADAGDRHKNHRRIETFEMAVARAQGACGLFVGCGCDIPGGLQCCAHSVILEEAINSSIGGSQYSRVIIIGSSDGVLTGSLWVTSGPSIQWSYGRHFNRVPSHKKGQRYISDWSVLG